MSSLLLETPRPKITLGDFEKALSSVNYGEPVLIDSTDEGSPSSIKSSQGAYRDVHKVIYSDPTKKSKPGEVAPRMKGAKPKAVKRLLQESPTKRKTVGPTRKATHVAVVTPCEELARALQSPSYSASGAKHSADILYQTFSEMGEQQFEKAWTAAADRASELKLNPAPERRTKKIPARFQHSTNPALDAGLDEKSELRRNFTHVLDILKAELKRRFEQPGMLQEV